MPESTGRPSRIIDFAPFIDPQAVPVFVPFGEPDDHLRLTVLLAEHLGARVKKTTLREAAAVCAKPDAAWSERMAALGDLLGAASALPVDGIFRCHSVIYDLDALHPGYIGARRRWADRDFLRERLQFFELLTKRLSAGEGWLALRPNPRPKVSKELPRELTNPGGSIGEPAGLTKSPDDEWLPEAAATIGVEFRPILKWLMHEKRALLADDVEEIVESGGLGTLEDHAIMLAYELLRPSVRAVGRRLSALRSPQALNGVFGPYPISAIAAEPKRAHAKDPGPIAPEAIAALAACGFLQTVGASSPARRLRMPSPVRGYLQSLARIEAPDLYAREQRWLGKRPLTEMPLAEKLEAHHHAVEGEDLGRAKETAIHYGADLRQVAFRLSIQEKFFEASEVYKTIVEDFDHEDAYAWEYRGYNLARAYAPGDRIPKAQQDEIRMCYQSAVDRDPLNPLYKGRLLGFEACFGKKSDAVSAAFNATMHAYMQSKELRKGQALAAAGFFAAAVFNGLSRGQRTELRANLEKRWRAVLASIDNFDKYLSYDRE